MRAKKARGIAVALSCLVSVTSVVLGSATPASADTATYTNAQTGPSGQTPQFSQTGPWTMTWSYDCSASGSAGNFIVNISQPAGDPISDLGANELGTDGAGTDYYQDSGTFSLVVNSGCAWSITVSPSSTPPASYTTTYSSAQTGGTGQTSQFLEQAPWTLRWSYSCPSGPGTFSVDVNAPAGDQAFDLGPNASGASGAGTDSYSDTGVFSLSVISGCTWTITVGAGLPLPVTGMASTPPFDAGYWLVGAGGGVSPHGDAVNFGSMASQPLAAPIKHIVATPDGQGYWLVAADGGVFTFGDAGFYGSMGGRRLRAPVIDMAPTRDGRGYWLVASDGGVFAFGDASFEGSMGGRHLTKPVVGIAPDDATGGYWLVASDGGVFAFDAPFEGSAGGVALARPVNGISPTPNDLGYWLVASDGGVFAFDSPFEGSMGGRALDAPIVGMATNNLTGGYWLVGADGGVFSFDAPFFGAD
jgi:hypothetical protein